MKVKKTLKTIWEIIKAIYAVVGVLIILPAAVIIATGITIQKKIKKKFKHETHRS